ncbi:MAG: two-component sensor histidine kinase [Hyphomicrobiales bacterium]|nr:two-component sensor histidine kinase [Hyphomicrobiales bacterium]
MQQRDMQVSLAALIDALPEAALAVSNDERVLALNASAAAVFPGLRVDETLVRGWRAPDALNAIARAFASGAPQQAQWLDRVPVERQFEIHAAPVAGFPACLVVLRDVTEARRIDRMRADFVANASHELRTPLASVLGFVETLQGPAANDPAARERFLAIMRDQARRMARLVDDLLSLSRIEQNLHLRPQGVVDLSGLAHEIADSLRGLARESGATIELRAAADVFVFGDRDDLLRVIENLIENAIKYGGPAPIAVSVERAGDMARLTVRDRGPGIAAEHLPRLTERFYRVDAGASKAKGGTGLGLAIVKHIVARHHGRLSIESRPGEGSTFSIILPQAPERA